MVTQRFTDMRKGTGPIFEIIGGTKKFREALKKKIAAELDPKGILEKPKKKK